MKNSSKFILALSILALASSAQAADVAAGKAKFDVNCVVCHGAGGKGDGPAGAALTPKPRNFTDQAYMSKRTDADLTKVIKEGGAKNGLSASMAPYGGMLSDVDIANVVAYIRTLK